MVCTVEEIIQDVHAFYNKSAKRRRRLKALAENNVRATMEDKTIETLENTVERTIKKGISSSWKLLV